MEKSFLGRPLRLLCLAAAQEITHAAHSLSRLGELHVMAGYVSTLLSSREARLDRAPSLHVNRPLEVILDLVSNVFSFIIYFAFGSYLFLRFPGTVLIPFMQCAL